MRIRPALHDEPRAMPRNFPHVALGALSLLLAGNAAAQTHLLVPADLPLRAQAAAGLREALAAHADLPTTVALAAIAGVPLPAGCSARQRLDGSLRDANLAGDPMRADATLRADLGELIETLAFQPRREAPLPDGFPDFAAVDELELRHYPAYAMARTEMKAGGANGAFWPLFQHIQSNDIAMTAPVQMDWLPKGNDGDRPLRMAFLYGDPKTRPARVADGVEVVQVPAATVLSLGAIGDDRRDRVEEMRHRLLAWLAANPQWVVAGPLRTMGYNSPMVSRDRRYFEVQLPVHDATAARAVTR